MAAVFLDGVAGQTAYGNLIVQYVGSIGSIGEAADRFSDISGNAVYRISAMKQLFVDPANGDYTLRSDAPVFDWIPSFEQIPINEIGRY